MKNDPRLMGQESYLHGASLVFDEYRPKSERWDHEHCEFCFAKFGAGESDKKYGWHSIPGKNGNEYWICEECFEDFRKDFEFNVKE